MCAHHPDSPQVQECLAAVREGEIDRLDVGASVRETEGGRTAALLDGGVDAQAYDVRTVREPQTFEQRPGNGAHEVPPVHRLLHGGARVGPRHDLKRQRDVLRGARHGSGHRQVVPGPGGRVGRH